MCPTEFKVGLNKRPPPLVQADDMGAAIRNVTIVCNNTGISRVFTDLMYSQRAFVHWYTGEGMEDEEGLRLLEKDYLDVLAEQGTYEEDGSDDDC